MKYIHLLIAAIVTGLLLGAVTGLVASDDAYALEGVQWQSNPGTASATPNLNCGWHTDCLAPADWGGAALDWFSTDYANVYFRGWGFRSVQSEVLLQIGTVYIGQRDDSCYNAVGDIVDTFGTYRGRVNYTHSYRQVSEGYSFYIYAKGSGNYQSVWVAYSYPASSEVIDKPYCATTGTHLHQYSNYASWTKNSSGYPVDNCSCSQGGQGNITAAAKWMYHAGWTS